MKSRHADSSDRGGNTNQIEQQSLSNSAPLEFSDGITNQVLQDSQLNDQAVNHIQLEGQSSTSSNEYDPSSQSENGTTFVPYIRDDGTLVIQLQGEAEGNTTQIENIFNREINSQYPRRGPNFHGYQLQIAQQGNGCQVVPNIPIQPPTTALQYNVEEIPRLNYPLEVRPQTQSKNSDPYKNLTDLIKNELKCAGGGKSESLLAKTTTNELDAADKEILFFPHKKVAEKNGNNMFNPTCITIDSQDRDGTTVTIDVEEADEEQLAGIKRLLADKSIYAKGHDGQGHILTEGTYLPGTRNRPGKLTFRINKADELLQSHTNGTLECNTEEYYRRLQKPQNTVDWMKSNRRSGSKAVVSPLPGSGSSSQPHDGKRETLNRKKSNLTIGSDISRMPSEVQDDLTDITYGKYNIHSVNNVIYFSVFSGRSKGGCRGCAPPLAAKSS